MRKRWSVSFSVSRLPEIQRPERKTVLIGRVPFRLDEDARSSSGAGWLVSAGGSFSPRLSDDLRGVLGASVATKRYRRSEWNDLSASGDIGLARLFAEGSVSGGLRFGRRWAGGERLHRSFGPWARLRRRLNDSTHVDVALGAVHRTHESRPERDGWRVTVNPRFVHVLDGRISIEAEPTFEVINAEADRHSSRLTGLGATVSRAFNRGFSVSLSSSAHVRRHDAPDPLFGERRADRYLRVEARGAAPFPAVPWVLALDRIRGRPEPFQPSDSRVSKRRGVCRRLPRVLTPARQGRRSASGSLPRTRNTRPLAGWKPALPGSPSLPTWAFVRNLEEEYVRALMPLRPGSRSPPRSGRAPRRGARSSPAPRPSSFAPDEMMRESRDPGQPHGARKEVMYFFGMAAPLPYLNTIRTPPARADVPSGSYRGPPPVSLRPCR